MGTERTNLEILEGAIAAALDERWEDLEELITPDFVTRRPFLDFGVASRRSFGSEWRTVDGVKELMAQFEKELGGIDFTVRKARDASPDHVIAEILYRIGPEDSATYQVSWGLYGFREGRVATAEMFATEEEAKAELDARLSEG